MGECRGRLDARCCHWSVTNPFPTKVAACGPRRCFFFAETFWSLNHFGYLSHSYIKLTATVFFSLYFQTFWPKWLNFFQSLQKHFGLWPKKNGSGARNWRWLGRQLVIRVVNGPHFEARTRPEPCIYEARFRPESQICRASVMCATAGYQKT